MKKKKNYAPLYPGDIQIDEKGRGTFNALTVLWQLRTIIKETLAPSDEEVSKLVTSKKVTWDEAQAELLKQRDEDIQKYYEYGENLLRAEIGPYMDDVLWGFVGDIAKRTISELTPEIKTRLEENSHQRITGVIKNHQAHKRSQLGLPDPTRPKGTGLFRNTQEFLSALEEVLRTKGELSQPKALYNLSRHPLYRGKPQSIKECEKKGKTLRNWLKKSNLTWEQALEKYSSKNNEVNN